MNKKKQLQRLKAELEELKSRDPSHCSGTEAFIGHSIPPELFKKIEELEGEIRRLEEELKE